MITSRIVSALAGLATLAIAARALTPSDFTFFVIVTTLLAAVAILDLGIGAAAQGIAVRSESPNQVWGTAVAALFCLALASSPLLIVLASNSASPAVGYVCISCVIIWLPLSLSERFRINEGRAQLNALLSVGAGLSAVAVAATLAQTSNPVWMTVAPIASQTLLALVNSTLIVFNQDWPQFRPTAGCVGDLVRVGSSFLVLQLCTVSLFQLDPLFAGLAYEPASLTGFLVASKLAVAGTAVLGAATAPIMPRLAASRVSLDSWQRELRLVKLYLASLLAVNLLIAGATLMGVFDSSLRLVFGDSQAPSGAEVSIALLLVASFTVGSACLQVLTALGLIRVQAFLALGCLALKLATSLVFVRFFDPISLLAAGALAILIVWIGVGYRVASPELRKGQSV